MTEYCFKLLLGNASNKIYVRTLRVNRLQRLDIFSKTHPRVTLSAALDKIMTTCLSKRKKTSDVIFNFACPISRHKARHIFIAIVRHRNTLTYLLTNSLKIKHCRRYQNLAIIDHHLASSMKTDAMTALDKSFSVTLRAKTNLKRDKRTKSQNG